MEKIVFAEYPFTRIEFIDLLDESKDMQWKILDYHNQDFVLNSIVDSVVFTPEGHEKFLKILPTLDRKHLIAYVDGRPVGKVSYSPTDLNKSEHIGYYLFHQDDMGKGYGLLMVTALFVHLFSRGFDELYTSVKISNSSSNGLLQKLGAKIYKTDAKCNYYVCCKEDFYAQLEKIKIRLLDKIDR